jgi:Sulfate permease family
MSLLPISAWLPTYRRDWLRFDLIAGLTIWALVVPQSIAYAQIAGLPPQAGVFCSFAAPLGYALFGSSRQLIVSPTSATAAISASLVGPLVVGDAERYWDLSATLAILCGHGDVGSTFLDVVSKYAGRLRSVDGKLLLSGLDPAVKKRMAKTGHLQQIGEENVFVADEFIGASTEAAFQAGEAWLAMTPAAEPAPAPDGVADLTECHLQR